MRLIECLLGHKFFSSGMSFNRTTYLDFDKSAEDIETEEVVL